MSPAPGRPPPDVSVLLPYRNGAATIGEALDSILGQRDVTLEIVAIDDGSTDDSPSIVRARAATDARIVRLESPRPGIASALVAGLDVARARLVARMDADDVSVPDRLARQLEHLATTPETDVCATQVEPFASASSGVGGGMRRYCDWQNRALTPEEHLLARFVESPVCHPSVVIRRELLARLGPWRDGPFPEDYELWLRLLASGARFRKLPERLYRWRVHAGQSTFRDARYSPESIRALRAEWLARELCARDRPVVCWGAGPTGTRLVRALEPHGVRVRAFVDIDPRKIGSTRRSVPVLPPTALQAHADVIVVAVGAAGARDLVREWLRARGFVEGPDFLCAA
ncbi:MAG: glycosyltransferase [Deltaproteobacteria bacterium]|nr:glycosyltransferase [Deltaproteobacteria bacterium]